MFKYIVLILIFLFYGMIAACDKFESTNGELKKKERVLKKLMEDYVKKYDEVKTWKKAAEEALDRHEGHGYYSRWILYFFSIYFSHLYDSSILFLLLFLGLSPMPPRLAEVVKPFTPRGLNELDYYCSHIIYFQIHCKLYLFSDWFEDSFSESVPASLERETDSQHNNTTIVSSSCADQLDDV